MRQIYDGTYEVPYSCEYDNGYGVESACDEITIVIEDGDAYASGHGLHFVTEDDVEWELDLTTEECFELIHEHCTEYAWSYTVQTEKQHSHIGWIGGYTAKDAEIQLEHKYGVPNENVSVEPVKATWKEHFERLKREA